jgi:TetR/AcrR family transcriptional regulator, cholesterol catabolism regulator
VTPAGKMAAGSRPPKRRRSEVLEVAARVFRQKGYESTSIQDIADAMGILKGSLYYYIRAKEDLLYEILAGVQEEALANIKRVSEMEGDALQKIRSFCTTHLLFNAEHLTEVGVLYHDSRSLGGERRRHIAEARAAYDGLLQGFIRDGLEDGGVCPDVDPKVAAQGAMGMLNWIYQWDRPTDGLKEQAVADEFADLVVNGLACDRKTHTPGHRSKTGALPASSVARPNGSRKAAKPPPI